MNHILILSFVLVAGLSAAFGNGRQVTIFRHDGQVVSGELISVRQDQISVYTGLRDLSDAEIMQHPAGLVDVPVEEIDSLYSEGHSHVLSGMAIGTGIGLAGGMIIGAASANSGSHHDEFLSDLDRGLSAAVGGGIGLAAGLTIGTLMGIASSTSDVFVRHPSGIVLADLAAESRLPLQGPDAYGVLKIYSKYGFYTSDDAIIVYVNPHSPAFDNDLRYRDRILAINGTAVDGSSSRDLRRMINQNDSLKLDVLRGEDTLSVVLQE